MTTDDHQNETNQDIFDDYVRYMLQGTGVEYIDQPVEQIIQTIEHGEAGSETALNLVAIAYVTMIFAYCPTPFSSMTLDEVMLANENEQAPRPWFIQLLSRVPKIGSVLGKCEDLLKDLPDHDGRPEYEATSRIICSILPAFCSAPSMKSLQAKRLFSPDKITIDSILLLASDKDKKTDQQKSATGDAGSNTLTTGIGQLFSNLTLTIHPNLRTFPSWHLYYFGHGLDARFYARTDMAYWEWCSAVDFIADLMRQGAILDNTDLDHEWGFENKYPVWSAEHWAWQFGRVTSLFLLAKKDFDEQEGIEIIEELREWGDNGLAAFSIIAGGPQFADLQKTFDLWSGVYASMYNEIGEEQQPVDSEHILAPYNQTPKSRLYWIMRLGYLAGREDLKKEPKTSYIWKNTGSEVEVEEITQPTISALTSKSEIAPPQHSSAVGLSADIVERVTETILQVQDSADYRREEEVRAKLSTHLGEIATLIHDDAMDAVVAAECAFLLSPIRRARHFSLDYAKAVECVLEDWLTPPREQKEWPGSDIGEWCDVLRKMSRPQKERRHSLDPVVRRYFDAGRAAYLAERLDVVRKLRVRDAHDNTRPPRPQVIREYVLGTDSSPSIFELILRFAKKWPPQQK